MHKAHGNPSWAQAHPAMLLALTLLSAMALAAVPLHSLERESFIAALVVGLVATLVGAGLSLRNALRHS